MHEYKKLNGSKNLCTYLNNIGSVIINIYKNNIKREKWRKIELI
jgi:hypothetical protein